MPPGLRPQQLLQAFLGSFPPQAFLDKHWERRPLHVKGHPSKWDDLIGFKLDLSGFDQLTAGLEAQASDIQSLYRARKADYDGFFLCHRDHGQYVQDLHASRPTELIPRDRIPEVIAQGHSVQLNGIEGLLYGEEPLSRWARFADGIRAALHYPGEFYLGATRSPAGARFHAHYDPSPGFILQTHGRKRYTFGEVPVKPWPNRKGYRFASGGYRYAGGNQQDAKAAWEEEDPEGRMESVVMEPGDLLYLPPGVVHETEALEPSIAVLMLPPNVRFNAVIADILDRALGHLEAWRRTPICLQDPLDGNLPAAWIEHNRFLLREVQRVLSHLDPAGYEFTAGWKALAGLSAASERLVAKPLGDEVVQPEDQLRMNPEIHVLFSRGKDQNGTKRAALYIGSRKLEVQGAWVRLLEKLPKDGTFRAKEALAWRGRFSAFDWEGVRACLGSLLAEGILIRA